MEWSVRPGIIMFSGQVTPAEVKRRIYMLFLCDAKCIGTYDAVIAGGGPAGFGAAVAAARGGLKVLLVESGGCIGGVSTLGALPFMLGASTGSIPFPKMIEKGLRYRDLPHPGKAVGGVFDLFVNAVKARNGGVGPAVVAQTDQYPGLDRLGCHDEFTFDLETGKLVFDEMALSYGAEILYYTRALRADLRDGRVQGIWLTNKDSVVYVSCKAIIDCTGDADIVSGAGYETYKGDRRTGEMTGAGLVAHIENIDPGAIEKYLNEGGDPWFTPACAAAQAENPDYEGPNALIIFPMMQKGVFMINGGTSRSGIDGTSAASLTELTLWGRKRAEYITEEIFRKHIPGAEHCRLRITAPQPGVRETRRIVGEYTLTEEDLLNGTLFEDTIALAGRHFDLSRGNGMIQESKPSGGVPDCRNLKQAFARDHSVKLGVTMIPYRSLIPKGSDDIIAAGRCIAADGQALGPARIMSTCMAVGEAAGTATVLKLKNQSSYRDVDYGILRELLRKNGAVVDSNG